MILSEPIFPAPACRKAQVAFNLQSHTSSPTPKSSSVVRTHLAPTMEVSTLYVLPHFNAYYLEKAGTVIIPVYRWKDWGEDWLSNLLKAHLRTQVCPPPDSQLLRKSVALSGVCVYIPQTARFWWIFYYKDDSCRLKIKMYLHAWIRQLYARYQT